MSTKKTKNWHRMLAVLTVMGTLYGTVEPTYAASADANRLKLTQVARPMTSTAK
ncbi:hypothetical protein [Tumebacillus flagellatus]|uniref:hypothetical protein n=1 Tax=Tumebacillus flagellatus TaxID=1157490 RepID=UPI001378A1BC|nr:hypothetical protein [Tumebacillus flagellatus]